MTGKVFSESANIYDDEAKILFDYYKKAAEKIVGEEIELENKIEAAQNRIDNNEKTKKNSMIGLIACGVIVLAGVILALASSQGFFVLAALGFIGAVIELVIRLRANGEVKRSTDNIAAYTQAKNDIRRDFKVTKMGVAYVPIATRVPFEGKSFVVDHTGGMPNTDFSLAVLRQPKALQESLSLLEDGIHNVPVVEGNEDAEPIDTSDYSRSVQNVTLHNYMGNIDRQVRNISYLLHDSDTKSVSLPVVPPSSGEDKFIDEYATTDTGDKPIVNVFSTEGFSDKLESFSQINEMKKELEKNSNQGNTEYFKNLIRELGDVVQLVSALKTNSTSKLLDYTNSILSAVMKAGYNHYSPKLEQEEIDRLCNTEFNYEDCVETYKPFGLKESSRVRYEIFSNSWVSEDNSRTNNPFFVNQVEEEVLMPLINNLMNETRVERLKMYNDIQNQKLSYLNKWHQDVEAAFRDNRKAGQDLITQITNAYAEYTTAHNTYLSYKNTQDSMKMTRNLEASEVDETVSVEDSEMAALESSVESCHKASEEFQEKMDALQADIQMSSEQFGHVEYYEGSLRDLESRDIARSIQPQNLQALEPRRQRIIPFNPYFATYAQVPPAPNVEEKLLDDFTMNMQQVASQELYRIETETEEATSRNSENMNDEVQSSTAHPEPGQSSDETENFPQEDLNADATIIDEDRTIIDDDSTIVDEDDSTIVDEDDSTIVDEDEESGDEDDDDDDDENKNPDGE